MRLIQAAAGRQAGRRDCGWQQPSKQADCGARAGYFGKPGTSVDRTIVGSWKGMKLI